MALTRGHRPLHTATALQATLFPFLLLCFLSAPGCSREEEPEMTTPPAGIIQEVSPGQSVTTDVNARAPAFARETMGGETVRTQDFIGRQVVLLDFWSVFCQSCLEEIPFLQELYRDYHDQGLEIISINTDFFPSARIAGFMKKTGIDLPFPLVLDRDQSLSKLFKVEALPVTVLIDSSGWIRMVHLGYGPSDEKMIEKRVRKACDRIKETIVTLQPVEGRTAFAPPDAGGESLLEAGASAPDFHAADREGRETSFSELRGDSPAVVFFWSLFCQPCREEFPVLVDLARTYAPRGLKTFAVNLDTEKLFPAAAAFARKNGGNLTALFEDAAAGGESGGAASFGVRYTPSTFLLAGDGTISYSSSGEFPNEDLKREIDLLLSSSFRESD
jgi:peroxiredoxin